MRNNNIVNKVNNSKIISRDLTHSLFTHDLRGGLVENFKKQSLHVPNNFSSHINKERNEMFKKTNIVFDNDSKYQDPKFSTLKTFKTVDHLKNYKDTITEPKKLSHLRLKKDIDIKEGFDIKNKKLDTYEKFYNEKPSTIMNESRKIKIESTYKRSSMDYNGCPSHYYNNSNRFNTIGDNINNRNGITPTDPKQSKLMKENIESIRSTLIKRPLGGPNIDKVNNQSTNILTESVNNLRKENNQKYYKPKKTYSYAFNNLTGKSKSGFYC